MMKCDSNFRLEGRDYERVNNKFVIRNVPIIAELVQLYNDGFAYKPKSEILKVGVENVPITMRSDVPDHPVNHLSLEDVGFQENVRIGYMIEPRKPKNDMSGIKRYADFVIEENDKTKVLIDKYLSGDIVDVSIGFNFKKDNTVGKFGSVRYDYVQRDIGLDHVAVLLDINGHVGIGRMPSPIGGIGADKNDIGGDIMSEDLKNKVSELQKQNDILVKKLAATDAEEVKKQFDSLVKARDEAEVKAEEAEAKVEVVEEEKKVLEEEKKEVSDKLQVFLDKEKAAMDSMREDLKKSNPLMSEAFDSISDDLVKKYHADIKKMQSRDIGADMMGVVKEIKSEAENIKKWTGKEK